MNFLLRCVLGLLLLAPLGAIGQEKVRKLHPDVFFGGGLGLQFGTVSVVEASPIVGYRIKPQWSVGAEFTYQYFSDNSLGTKFSSSIYGIGAFTRYAVVPKILLHAGWETLNLDVLDAGFNKLDRQWVQSYLVGVGYRSAVGERSGLILLVLWNLNETYSSPYTNPIVKIQFEF